MKISSTGQYNFRQPVSCSSLVIDVTNVRTGISLPAGLPGPKTSVQVPDVLKPFAAHTSRNSDTSESLCCWRQSINSFGTGPANAWFAAGL